MDLLSEAPPTQQTSTHTQSHAHTLVVLVVLLGVHCVVVLVLVVKVVVGVVGQVAQADGDDGGHVGVHLLGAAPHKRLKRLYAVLAQLIVVHVAELDHEGDDLLQVLPCKRTNSGKRVSLTKWQTVFAV